MAGDLVAERRRCDPVPDEWEHPRILPRARLRAAPGRGRRQRRQQRLRREPAGQLCRHVPLGPVPRDGIGDQRGRAGRGECVAVDAAGGHAVAGDAERPGRQRGGHGVAVASPGRGVLVVDEPRVAGGGFGVYAGRGRRRSVSAGEGDVYRRGEFGTDRPQAGRERGSRADSVAVQPASEPACGPDGGGVRRGEFRHGGDLPSVGCGSGSCAEVEDRGSVGVHGFERLPDPRGHAVFQEDGGLSGLRGPDRHRGG